MTSSQNSQPISYDRFDPLNAPTDNAHALSNDLSSNYLSSNVSNSNGSASADGNTAGGAKLSASQVEELRAQALLDRAFSLWERGDVAGAIASCRQSLALAPRSSGAHSMLGLLLERAGDAKGAIAAYEKAVEIEPSSLLERDSARRLRASLGAENVNLTGFGFSEEELFNTDFLPEVDENAPLASADDWKKAADLKPTNTQSSTRLPTKNATPLLSTTLDVQPAVPLETVRESAAAPSNISTANAVVAPAISPRNSPRAIVSTPPTSAQAAKASPTVAAPTVAAPVSRALQAPNANSSSISRGAESHDLGLSSENAIVTTPIFSTPVGTQTRTPTSAIAAATVQNLANMPLRRATFWVRSWPLLAAAGSGFLFLLWSRNVASERERAVAPVSTTTIINNSSTVPLANAGTFGAAPVPGANAIAPTAISPNVVSPNVVSPNMAPVATPTPLPVATPVVLNGLVVNNAPAPNVASNARRARNGETRRPATETARRERNPDARERSSSSSAPSVATRSPLPDVRTIPPASVSGLPRTAGATTPVAPTSVAPSFDADSGGIALPIPDGSASQDSGNGGIRPFSGKLPVFPAPSQVRSQNQIRPTPFRPAPSPAKAQNTAYEYQTRALIYLEQGQNARAASDFQSAMALYRRQIARGDRNEETRRGLEACRQGLSLVAS